MDRSDEDEKGRSSIPTLGGQQEMLMASPSPMEVKPYSDEEGREYPVDAGVIGIVPLELVGKEDGLKCGTVIMMPGIAALDCEEGVFDFCLPDGSTVHIDTRE